MDTPSPSVRALAKRLLAIEAAIQSADGTGPHEVVRVCQKLRISLTRFAGAAGFESLLRRALALARLEVPSLHGIEIKPDCTIEGLEALARNDGTEAGTAITAHLLGLLVTFIGQPLTLRLVRETWPDASLSD